MDERNHHQMATVEHERQPGRAQHHIHHNIPPGVYLILTLLATVILAVYAASHWFAFLSDSQWIFHGLMWLGAAAGVIFVTGYFIERVIQPAIRAWHMVKKTKVLAQEKDYAYIDGTFHQVSQERHTFNYKGEIGNAPPQLLPSVVAQPSQEQLLARIGENQLIVSPGVRKDTGEPVTVSIVAVPHFKLIGGSGFGKSCLAGSILDQATKTNDPQHFQLALLDLEHKTSRLFEDLPHIAHVQVGRRFIQMVATDADEVVEHLGYLKKELDRRASLSEQELAREPVLFIYVEEMLSLQYEVDPQLLDRMFAGLNVLSVRGRKYGMFMLACMQTDYSSTEMRVSQRMFRFRAAASIDTSAARAAGFINNELIKQNFQLGQPGQFVVEYPSFSQIVIAPNYDVQRLVAAKTRFQDGFRTVSEVDFQAVKPARNMVETTLKNDETTLQARFQDVANLRENGWRKVAIVEKLWRVKAGGSQAYKDACSEYEDIIEQIEQDA